MKKLLCKTVLSLLILVAGAKQLNAQDYNTGIGVRIGGLTSGITVKHFVSPNSALEGIVGFAHRSFVITGLYEGHRSIQNAEGLRWLYGGGAHVGFFRYGGYYYAYRYRGDNYYVLEPGRSRTIAGLDFILGLDYKFKNAPVNVGLDIKPFVDFYDGASGYFDGGLSFRFVF